MIMLMLIFSVIAVIMHKKGMTGYYGVMFVIAGMATAFFDFLTTETLPLLVPLLIILWLSRRENRTTRTISR